MKAGRAMLMEQSGHEFRLVLIWIHSVALNPAAELALSDEPFVSVD